MVSVKDVPADKLIDLAKEEFKRNANLAQPEWAGFVKSGSHRERPPAQPDFWFIRLASLLRRIYLDGPVGVERLRTYYGGRKNMGVKPHHFRKSGGKMLRVMTQKLEKDGFIKFNAKGQKGRVVTPKGRKFLDNIAHHVLKRDSPNHILFKKKAKAEEAPAGPTSVSETAMTEGKQ